MLNKFYFQFFILKTGEKVLYINPPNLKKSLNKILYFLNSFPTGSIIFEKNTIYLPGMTT